MHVVKFEVDNVIDMDVEVFDVQEWIVAQIYTVEDTIPMVVQNCKCRKAILWCDT